MEKFENLVTYNEIYCDELVQRSQINIDKYITYTNEVVFTNIEFLNIILTDTMIKSIENKYSLIIGTNRSTLPYNRKYTFYNCTFLGELNLNNTIKRTLIFENCTFNNIILAGMKKVSTEEIQNGFILKNIKSIKNLTIDSCEFHDKFYINKQDDEINNQINIEKLIIKNTLFKNNFKLHNCRVDEVEIKDIDFEKNADFYKSKFIKGIDENDIYFKSINFKGLALFGDTEFFQKLIFKYVTFEGHNHFKSAKLHKGLDLEYTNIQKEINFYGMEILDKTTTSQETYRIIKNQFEKLNNKIEANKYHALELDQRKRELEKDKCGNFAEYLVFKIHDLSSKHSTSYFRPVWGIILVGLFTIFWVHFNIVIDLIFNHSSFKFEYLAKICNEFWQYINITNLEKLKDKPFIFFLNKVSLGYLYYQFLTAVRKDTRK